MGPQSGWRVNEGEGVNGGIWIIRSDEDGQYLDRILRLYYDVLYRDYGVAEEADWAHMDAAGELLLAVTGERVLGAIRLLGTPGERSRQLRQLAVEPAVRGGGIGTGLVRAAEESAAAAGACEVWLHARDTAFRFYERLGYEYSSELFVSELTGIPHRTMRRDICSGGRGLDRL